MKLGQGEQTHITNKGNEFQRGAVRCSRLHVVKKWQCWDSNPGLPSSKAHPLQDILKDFLADQWLRLRASNATIELQVRSLIGELRSHMQHIVAGEEKNKDIRKSSSPRNPEEKGFFASSWQ